MDRGILFKPYLVERLPTKTETRRLIKTVPAGATSPVEDGPCRWLWKLPAGGGFRVKHRFGVPGDRLYVREPWAIETFDNGQMEFETIVFLAGYSGPERKWRAAIHLRRDDARYFLLVKSVRPERLLDIDDRGARAEGFANREDFLAAWDDINMGTLTSVFDPWVWVIVFEFIDES